MEKPLRRHVERVALPQDLKAVPETVAVCVFAVRVCPDSFLVLIAEEIAIFVERGAVLVTPHVHPIPNQAAITIEVSLWPGSPVETYSGICARRARPNPKVPSGSVNEKRVHADITCSPTAPVLNAAEPWNIRAYDLIGVCCPCGVSPNDAIPYDSPARRKAATPVRAAEWRICRVGGGESGRTGKGVV